MSAVSLVFAPQLPWWLLVALAVPALVLVGLSFWRRARGAAWRAVFLTLVLLFLANPILRREQREPLDDLELMLSDRSPSQGLGERPAQHDAAERELRERLGRLPGVELREVRMDGESREGTRLFTRLQEAMAESDRARLGAVIALTDGQAHDAPTDPAKFAPGAPLHVLLTGHPDESDRQLVVLQAPGFGVVGEPQTLELRVDDAAEPGADVPITLRQDGQVVRQFTVRPGAPTQVPFTLGKAGTTVIEVEAAARPGELTNLNNRATVQVSGVRDRLRVLVVSGQPYPGLRVWRNLLKADPAVDLVHFTILRPPEKQDGTPIRELALIAFPSRELFEVKLKEFDLIIFDNYSRRGLLPLVYLENIARYVEEGGALLEAAGPQFAEPLSLYRTPLARVLPGRPSGEVFERGYKPVVTELGRNHPVTANLGGAGEPEWGRWFRQLDVETEDSQILMTGVSDRPLLVLKRVGQGRVAQLLSDHAWLWARGFEGGGPQALLLRRLVHWLMKEPQLEEEALRASTAGNEIVVERQSLKSEPIDAVVTSPSGRELPLHLAPVEGGSVQGRFKAEEDGVYRITAGEHTAYASPRPIAAVELADMRATERVVTPTVEATGGSVRWLAQEGVPDLRRVDPGRRAYGRGWLGIERHGAYRVLGMNETPLLPAWLALALLLGAAVVAWWREGRS
ncbi:MAG: hypothetical protein ACJ8H8_29085 [Geminicoccaceae bacterium]